MLEIGEWIAVTVFGNSPGQGSPMVVMRLADWLPDDVLYATSRRLPAVEVTFVVINDSTPVLRWFGPHGEVPFCGHGAVAASEFLTDCKDYQPIAVFCGTGQLRLLLGRDRGFPMVQMPTVSIMELESNHIDLGIPIVRLFDAGRDYLAVVSGATLLRSMRPPREKMLSLDKIGIILTAQTSPTGAVFRFFAPHAGIDEDRVSCSVLPTLAALWLEGSFEYGNFVQCSDIDIPMSVRSIGNGWRVAGPVYVIGQGTWNEVSRSMQNSKREAEC